MRVDVELQGFRELDQALEQLVRETTRGTGRNTLRRAGAEALEPMRDLARDLAPKEEGLLAESIIIKPGWNPKFNLEASNLFAMQGSAAGVRREAGLITVGMGPAAMRGRALYAWYQEWGVVHHAANPYMRPAFDAEARATLDRVGAALKVHIERAAERARRRTARRAG